MSYATLDEKQIKELVKQAVLELFQEHRDVLYDALAEIIEDIALANAIREGESTDSVSREEVLEALEVTA